MSVDSDLWGQLRSEHAASRVGRLWLAEISRSVRQTIRRYPPVVYAASSAWDEDAISVLIQDVVIGQLLEEGQVEYIIDSAAGLPQARALIALNVRWTLARRRTRTVIDNLLDRCRPLFPSLGWTATGHGTATRWHPTDSTSPRDAHDSELDAAARLVAALPRVPVGRSDRAPVVFTAENLERALTAVSTVLPGGIGEHDLDRIFARALTDHLPGALVLFEGGIDEADRALTPEEQVIVRATIDEVRQMLTVEQRNLLALKLTGTSDEAVANFLSLSRPTVAVRRQEASAILRAQVEDLPQRVQQPLLSQLAELLVAEIPSTSTDPGPEQLDG